MSQIPDSPYGSWSSPLSAQEITETVNTPTDITIHQNQLFWLELRAKENSRLTLMTVRDGVQMELTPAPFNLRSRLHEYGGGAYLVKDAQAFFCNAEDQSIYCLDSLAGEASPVPITEKSTCRYADMQVDLCRGRLICIRESHVGLPVSSSSPKNEIIAIDLLTHKQEVLVSGADFYSSVKVSVDGSSLSWLCWNHPHMPWDETALFCGRFDEKGLLRDLRHIAGDGDESIFQPEWDCDNRLIFVSDRSNWWNLYRCDPWGDDLKIQCLYSADMEFGRPQWVCGQRAYSVNSQGEVVSSHFSQGQWQLATLTEQGLKTIGSGYSDLKSIVTEGEHAWAIASSPDALDQIVCFDLISREVTPVFPVQSHPLKAYFSEPSSITFQSGEQKENVQGYLYLPTNPDYSPSEDTLPPLIIKTHGGPSSAATSALDLNIQYWTSRGFALFDINYRGSTGFGRAFRERLYGNWGDYDVQDCLYGARHLVETKQVNPHQIIIRGHSAGGYTTLCALLFHDFFNAGASLYGISDLKKLSDECHKFESHYVDKLIGSEEAFAQRYQDRSPLYALEPVSMETEAMKKEATKKTTCPIIFMQGLKDKVVPPNQSQLMVNKLKENDVPVAYLEFPEEGHGFQLRKNRIKALEAELMFYRSVFNIEDSENLPLLEIFNLVSSQKK